MIRDLCFPNSAVVRVPERLVLRGGRWHRLILLCGMACSGMICQGPA
jgi:hypothetical protein